ncbi:hypothetical protein SAMN04515650_1178 [Halanaerobium congolense]|nr:hypothetical protein SAMN04515650_1178 [Halanaerobium congolense]
MVLGIGLLNELHTNKKTPTKFFNGESNNNYLTVYR